jgi:hypothetical protein
VHDELFMASYLARLASGKGVFQTILRRCEDPSGYTETGARFFAPCFYHPQSPYLLTPIGAPFP